MLRRAKARRCARLLLEDLDGCGWRDEGGRNATFAMLRRVKKLVTTLGPRVCAAPVAGGV